MVETMVVPEISRPVHQSTKKTMLAGVLVMSFASLLLELSLTRLFSVILFYHFAFLAISIALLGLGAGGVFSYVTKQWLERWSSSQIGTFVAHCKFGADVAVAGNRSACAGGAAICRGLTSCG